MGVTGDKDLLQGSGASEGSEAWSKNKGQAMDSKAKQLEYLMRRFGDEVLHLAYFYLKDRHAAEDVAQEVFLRVYSHLDEFRHEGSYHTWIYRIAVNVCRDRLRSWSNRNVFVVGDPAGEEGEVVPFRYLPAAADNAEHEAIRSLEADRVWEAVLSLPPKYREVLALHYYHDQPIKRIAQLTGLTESNVRVRLHRARQMVKEKLTEREGCRRDPEKG